MLLFLLVLAVYLKHIYPNISSFRIRVLWRCHLCVGLIELSRSVSGEWYSPHRVSVTKIILQFISWISIWKVFALILACAEQYLEMLSQTGFISDLCERPWQGSEKGTRESPKGFITFFKWWLSHRVAKPDQLMSNYLKPKTWTCKYLSPSLWTVSISKLHAWKCVSWCPKVKAVVKEWGSQCTLDNG